MPTYTVTDPRSKRTVKLTGDSPPTEAELHQVFAKLNTGAGPNQTMERAEDYVPAAGPTGTAGQRFMNSLGQNFSPTGIIRGVGQMAKIALMGDPVAANEFAQPYIEQGKQSIEAFKQGRTSEGFGHAAAMTPFIGPPAAAAAEQIAGGDWAGGAGNATGQVLMALAPGAAVRGAKAIRPTAAGLEAGAASRTADVMSPKVGPNKTRFGNQAEKVAPQIAKDMAADGAPWSREGLHDQVSGRLAQAEQGLDAATDQRLAARTFETKPLIDGLLKKRAELTAESVDGQRVTRTQVERTSPIVDERGQPIAVTEQRSMPIGRDVVPGPNAARVAVIDKAIAELQQLGPVTRYEPIRRIRQAYDGPAKTVYSPSMTADYLKQQGGKLGAADVTGTLRESLAQWDPETAAANADYSMYRTASDVLEATREVERTRPRVGRLIAARIFASVAGGTTAGPAGAAAGYIGAPLLDAGASMGMTTKLKVAAVQMRLAQAIRRGSVQQATTFAQQLRSMTPQNAAAQAGVAAGRQIPATARSDESPDRRTPVQAQR